MIATGIKINGVDIASDKCPYFAAQNTDEMVLFRDVISTSYLTTLKPFGITCPIDANSKQRFINYKTSGVYATEQADQQFIKYKGSPIKLASRRSCCRLHELGKANTIWSNPTAYIEIRIKWDSSKNTIVGQQKTGSSGSWSTWSNIGNGTYTSVVAGYVCAGGGGGASGWSAFLAWDSGCGGGGGAACEFLADLKHVMLWVKLGTRGARGAGTRSNGGAGGEAWLKVCSHSGSVQNTITLGGGTGGMTDKGNDTSVGVGGKVSQAGAANTYFKTTYVCAGGNGGVKASSITTAPSVGGSDSGYGGIFEDTGAESGGYPFIGLKGQTADRPGGGAGSSYIGRMTNLGYTTNAAPNPGSDVLKYTGYGSGGFGGALCHGNNYYGADGKEGCFGIHNEYLYSE